MKYLEALRKAAAGPAENKAMPGPAENKAEAVAEESVLEGVEFAHPSGRARAAELGLGAEAFKRRRKSSEKGFTVADVERIYAATDAVDEE